MRIGLLRHGIAEDASHGDFDRRLTREGWEQTRRLVDTLAACGWKPGTVLHSPYVRTAETALIVRARWPDVAQHALDDLAIGSMDAILRACATFPDPLLVGHEPTMGNLTARLVGAPSGSIRFERAGFALLEVDRLPTTRPAHLLVFLSPAWIAPPAPKG